MRNSSTISIPFLAIILSFLIGCTSTKVSKNNQLIWSDEFNYNGVPDSTKWAYDLGGSGWGNNELEYYTNRLKNAHVSNGTLKIVALKENLGDREYTSARLLTKGKFSTQYGRIETRAKLPSIVGTWPAIWMLGSNSDTVGWPQCGEIDIMEHKGSELNKIYGTLHYPGHSGANGNGKITMLSNATTEFNIYSLDWTPSSIKISVNGNEYFNFNNTPDVPFNHHFFLILNLAMGGGFAGPIDPAFSSDSMEVDYVRVYK
ncbi:MAG: family 16 glycosylhydrolase [Candidatus Dadabacteria bacterium]